MTPNDVVWIHISIHILWIASGLIEKNPNVIHNSAMTSDRHSISPYPLRLDAELRGQLEKSAKSVGRSLHAEIVARLEKSLNPIADEGDVMLAVRAIGEYSAKFDVSVSVNFSKTRESILADAIKNGTLPQDATLEDVDNPGPAVARMAAQKHAEAAQHAAIRSQRDVADAAGIAPAPTTKKRKA